MAETTCLSLDQASHLPWLDCGLAVSSPLSQSLSSCWPLLLLSWAPFLLLLVCLLQIFIWTCRGILRVQVGLPSCLTTLRLLVVLSLLILQSVLLHFSPSPLHTVGYGLIIGLLPVVFLIVLLQSWVIHPIPPTLLYFWITFVASRVPFMISNTTPIEFGAHIAILVLGVAGLVGEFFVCPPLHSEDKSPEEAASHASLLFYAWLDPLFFLGTKRDLGADDVPPTLASFSTSKILDKFRKREDDAADNLSFRDGEVVWERENGQKKGEVKIFTQLSKTYGASFVLAAFMKFIRDLLMFAIPKVLGALISYVDQDCGEAAWWWGYMLAVGLFIIGTTQTIMLQQYWKKTHRVALRARTVLFNEIYRKALVISNAAKKDYTVGEIVSLMSSDAQTFKQVIPSLNMVWSMPLQIILAVYFLYQELGPSVFTGVLVLVLLIPFNTSMGKLSQRFNARQLKNKDKRIRKMYELLTSFKVIKLYAWEYMFQENVATDREQEIVFLKKNAVVRALLNFVFGSAPIIVTLVSFATYVSIDPAHVLTPEKAFVCLTLFNMLKMPLRLLPFILTEIFKLRVSINRVNKFLNCTEITNYVGHLPPTSYFDLEIRDGTFGWSAESPTLIDINLSVRRGDLAVVTGTTGGGKSSLISALLGQMNLIQGKVGVGGGRKVAYVSQEAWLQNLTVRDNITFGKPFESQFYREVLQACALEEDFLTLTEGDMTVIGEQGVNMSGGQKQRVSLARAVYSRADIYILDDPLSAVDVHVAQHLMKCVLGPEGILKDKTRLLVTHNLAVVDLADDAFNMEQGKLTRLGTQGDDKDEVETASEEEVNEDTPMLDDEDGCNGFLDTKPETMMNGAGDHTKLGLDANKKDMKSRLQDKSVASGSAFVRAYSMFIKSFGVFQFILVLVLYLFNQAMVTGSSVWLTHWSDMSSAVENATEFDNGPYIGVYGAIGFGTAVFAFLRNLILFVAAARASRKIHEGLLNSLLRAQLGFIQSTSSGSVISRFSGDMDALDNQIPNTISAFLYNLYEVFGVIITISVSSPFFLLAVLPIFVIFYGIKIIYVRTSRQMKRLESSSNAPIYRHFSETIKGLPAIKAFGHITRFKFTLEDLLDRNLRYSYYSLMCARWLVLRTELTAQLLVLAAGLLAVTNKDSFSSGWAGLVVTLALSITETFNYLLNQLTTLEDQATVVERIKEMTKHTPQEPAWTSDNPPGPDWPTEGHLVLDRFSTGYGDDEGSDLVLVGLNLDIRSGEKVAVVGRTGAGKSSLALALLRVLEAKQGKITLDGLDIAHLGLHELRRAVTIIPQEPVLFSGSLRSNIDPSSSLSDYDVKQSLSAAQLDLALDTEVEEGGANFSQGERQLVCLARAVARGSRLIIMDEATASVDETTDQQIQEAMRTHFVSSTVVTIAHRLNTILDYDRVVVLDKGKVLEIGSPADLIEREGGVFRGMVEEMRGVAQK